MWWTVHPLGPRERRKDLPLDLAAGWQIVLIDARVKPLREAAGDEETSTWAKHTCDFACSRR